MPTIGNLLRAFKDARGLPYRDMEVLTGHEISFRQLQRWVEEGPKAFPGPRSIDALSRLLDLPVTTVVLSFASALGLDVRKGATSLEAVLPPGTDNLTAEDREAIRVVTRALINARTEDRRDTAGGAATTRPVVELHPPRPDLRRVAARRGESEGQRLRDQQDREVD